MFTHYSIQFLQFQGPILKYCSFLNKLCPASYSLIRKPDFEEKLSLWRQMVEDMCIASVSHNMIWYKIWIKTGSHFLKSLSINPALDHYSRLQRGSQKSLIAPPHLSQSGQPLRLTLQFKPGGLHPTSHSQTPLEFGSRSSITFA